MSTIWSRRGPPQSCQTVAMRLPRLDELDRRVLALAIPALGALVAEPLFLLADTAMVGHLGAPALAALGVASTILQTAVGLCIFLAYTTTPRVARRLGAGDRRGAVRAGIEGMWLGLAVGAALGAAGLAAARWLPTLIADDPEVIRLAGDYLAASAWGMPAMLLVIAASGLLRGLQDARTPLVVAGAGFLANIALNAILIYGMGLGVLGSAIGTVIAQWGMVAAYLVIAVRAARRTGAPLAPGVGGVRRAIADSSLMLLRTVTIRAVLIAVTVVGAAAGVAELAALQVIHTAFSLLAFALDALAIAAQSIVGHDLGAGARGEVRRATDRLIRWGLVSGLACGLLGLALTPFAGAMFTSDPGVLGLLPIGFALLALSGPLAGYVFVLDGVLIGAGDIRYLALAGLAPMAASLGAYAVIGMLGLHGGWAVAAIWLVFALVFLGGRGLVLGLRARRDLWMR